MMSMSPLGEVMYGTVELENSESQLELPGTYGLGFSRYGLMFWSRPLGSAPEVTGPYCSQTRSGALPPEAWLSMAALDAVMLAELFGSHWTVTFLCAAWYWPVSFFSPALSDALIGPVFGGRTALMVTLPPVPADEPLEEHPAASAPASSRAAAAASGVLMGILRTVPTSWFV